jgi:hypothetical protein
MLVSTSPQPIAIVEAFSDIADKRRSKGKRHEVTICLASFTLAVAAGNQGFIAIGDWLKAYRDELISLLKPEKERIPSYSTIRRVLLTLDYQKYSKALAKFFKVNPQAGETLAVDGKMLRGSYQLEKDNPDSPAHPSITLVTAYLVERELILPPYEVENKTNEIKALPEFIKELALKGVVFAFDAISTQKKLVS